MKKTISAVAFALLVTCAAYAQDTTHSNATTQRHKKTMHSSSSTLQGDSVNEGKITTNPNGKMGSKPSAMKRKKTTTNSSVKSSTDSTK